jgi:pimeloyl-ACP methyl ester carboxylesterase
VDVIEVRTTDGRLIRAAHDVDEGRPVLLVHMGTPHGLDEWPWLSDLASDGGLSLVTYARPGYAGSSPHVDATVADGVADSRAVLDALGVDRFVCLGISGGGPRALADGALLDDRCDGVVVIAGLAPFDAPDLDALAGFGPMNAPLFAAAVTGRQSITPMIEAAAEMLGAITPEQMRAMFAEAPDAAALDRHPDGEQILGQLAETSGRSYRDGMVGVADDLLAYVQPWGFAVDDVRCPVAVWHGALDGNVPQAHGRWIVDHAADGEGHWFDEHGHLSIVLELPSAIDRAARMAQPAPGATPAPPSIT